LGHPGVPYAIAFLIGVVNGMRAMTAPAAISWAAHSRTVPVQFGTRIAMGALCGAALTAAIGSHRPAAVTEDALAITGGLLACWAAR
jgi:uncharacterized membrane protein